MASDFFLKIDGIDGESLDKKHSKWIEVQSFAHGAVQSVDLGRGTDVSGRGKFEAFAFTHLCDKATPKLQQFCMNGKDIPKVEFQSCRAISGKRVVVYEVKLENVKIAKAHVHTVDVLDSNGSSAAQQAVEDVELFAKKITWKVTPVKPDNTLDGAVEASFDQVTNS